MSNTIVCGLRKSTERRELAILLLTLLLVTISVLHYSFLIHSLHLRFFALPLSVLLLLYFAFLLLNIGWLALQPLLCRKPRRLFALLIAKALIHGFCFLVLNYTTLLASNTHHWDFAGLNIEMVTASLLILLGYTFLLKSHYPSKHANSLIQIRPATTTGQACAICLE